jgi:hypothetical protein
MRPVGFLVLLSVCCASGQTVTRQELDARDVSAWQEGLQEKARLDWRLREIERKAALSAAGYVRQRPTQAEVEIRRQKWLAANPFIPSGRMPDFTKEPMTVKRSGGQVADSGDSRAEMARLVEQIAALERRLNRMEKSRPASPRPAPRAKAAPTPIYSATSLAPKPSGIAVRKLENGRVAAVIGGKAMEFKTEAEAQAYAASQKP